MDYACRGNLRRNLIGDEKIYTDIFKDTANLMKRCRDEGPNKRPQTSEVLDIIEDWIYLSDEKKIEDINEESKSKLWNLYTAVLSH
ncbi:hypothetical protein C1646_758541 [Rhizophagus diaphanus]|nr:hypothetical protein C1646_758541 [Rhizophagus diaphanus] [Rhizophagus sp. MUCL 43196]